MKNSLKILFLITLYCLACRNQPAYNKVWISKDSVIQSDNFAFDKEKKYQHIIDILGRQEQYNKAKWVMYCLYCDSLVRFKPKSGIQDTTTYYSQLELKLDSLFVSGDTLSFLFKFWYKDKVCDTNMVYNYNFPWWGIRYFNAKILSIQLFSVYDLNWIVTYRAKDDLFGEHIRLAYPEVIKHINDHRLLLHPWFLEEAKRQGLVR